MRPAVRMPGHAGRLGIAGYAGAAAGFCLLLTAAASRSGPLHLSLGHGPIHSSPPAPAPAPPRHPTRYAATGTGHPDHWLLVAGSGVVAVLALLTVVGLVRLLRQVRLGELGWRLRREPLVPPPAADGDHVLVARTVEAALAELQTGDSPRAAVIAAYAAMVGSLADAGTPGAAGLTPMRLLARSADVLQGGDAATLTALFERARFSEHPVTDADRADAQERLSAVLARLSLPVPA